MISEAIESLLLRSLTGTASSEDESALQKWKNAEAGNQKIYDEYLKVFHAMDAATPVPLFDTEKEWTRLEKRIGETAVIPLWGNFAGLYRVAACILLVVASIFVIREITRAREIIHESEDKVYLVKLHDGTSIWMKPNSRLSHSSGFNGESRNVTLTGEAYFDVAPDATRPFIITASASRIRVVGTTFMVRALPWEETTTVEVREGVVTLSKWNDTLKVVRLPAGTKGALHTITGTITTKPFSADNILAWKDRKLVFRKTTLDEVVDVVEDYFDIEIEVPNEKILSCRFTSSFDDPEITEVMEALSISLNMDVTVKDGKYIFDGEGCQ